mgnify:CR=1 FL=1
MKRSVWMSASAAVALSVVPVGTAAADEGSGPISAAEQATSPSSDAKADLPADPEPKTPAPAVPDPRGETPAPIPDPVPSLDPVPISVAGDDASGTDQQNSDTDSAAAQQNNSADPDEQGQDGQDAVSGSDDDPVQQEPQIGGPQGAEEAPAAPEEAPAQGATAVSREQASVSRRGGANRPALAQTGAGTTAAWMALGTGAAGAAMLMVRRRLAY